MSGYRLETLPCRPLKKSDVPLLFEIFHQNQPDVFRPNFTESRLCFCVGLEMDGYWFCQIAIQFMTSNRTIEFLKYMYIYAKPHSDWLKQIYNQSEALPRSWHRHVISMEFELAPQT